MMTDNELAVLARTVTRTAAEVSSMRMQVSERYRAAVTLVTIQRLAERFGVEEYLDG